MPFYKNILKLYKDLRIDVALPEGVAVLNPYQDETAWQLSTAFYKKFYNDDRPRTMILGINPGRFGGGVTGIPFTDPIKLETYCGIPNDLKKKSELSADFIYKTIEALGGPEKFYQHFYFSSISPLGFTKEGKNLNYYDIRELQKAIEPFAIACLQKHLKFNIRHDLCFCLGEGKNFEYLSALNKRMSFFKEVIPLAHPRFIMQYKRKSVDDYVSRYLIELGRAVVQ